MPLSKIEFQPGINKEATDYSAQGGWVDGNLVRFRKARVEKVGGWQQLGQNYFLGLGRALHSWISLGGTRFLGIGTTWKYYIEEGNAYNDVTPIRLVTSAGDVTFAASNGSSTITITDTAHGAVTNDFVTFSGAASLGGNVTAAVLNQEDVRGVSLGHHPFHVQHDSVCSSAHVSLDLGQDVVDEVAVVDLAVHARRRVAAVGRSDESHAGGVVVSGGATDRLPLGQHQQAAAEGVEDWVHARAHLWWW